MIKLRMFSYNFCLHDNERYTVLKNQNKASVQLKIH